MKATPKVGKISGINLVDETSEFMVISQFGKIIRIDTKSIRIAGRSTEGVRLLDFESQDKVAAVIPRRSQDPARRGNDSAVAKIRKHLETPLDTLVSAVYAYIAYGEKDR
jgi:hypothetical protein